MQHTEHIDDIAGTETNGTKHDEVTAFTTLPGDMEAVQPPEKLIARLCPDDLGTFCQGGDRQRKGFSVDEGLRLAKLFVRPSNDVLEIGLRGSRQTH